MTPRPVIYGDDAVDEAQRELKELRPVFGHKLNIIWKDLGQKTRDFLGFGGLVDDHRRPYQVREGEAIGPVVLWIGVAPETLFGGDAHTSAKACLDLLKEFDITDVEVEYRESTVYTRSPVQTSSNPFPT